MNRTSSRRFLFQEIPFPTGSVKDPLITERLCSTHPRCCLPAASLRTWGREPHCGSARSESRPEQRLRPGSSSWSQLLGGEGEAEGTGSLLRLLRGGGGAWHRPAALPQARSVRRPGRVSRSAALLWGAGAVMWRVPREGRAEERTGGGGGMALLHSWTQPRVPRGRSCSGPPWNQAAEPAGQPGALAADGLAAQLDRSLCQTPGGAHRGPCPPAPAP